jgi:hypothetical protein
MLSCPLTLSLPFLSCLLHFTGTCPLEIPELHEHNFSVRILNALFLCFLISTSAVNPTSSYFVFALFFSFSINV